MAGRAAKDGAGGAGRRSAAFLRLLSLALAFLVAMLAVSPADQGRRATASRAMVAAAHPLAAEAGLEVLGKGGSAVDAAIAMQLVLTLVEPQSSGIGGGGFLLVYEAGSGEVTAYDGRETAPAGARADQFLDEGGRPKPFYDAVVGGASVGVPGVLRMLDLAHRDHGRLPWAALFAPAIRLAGGGFPVSPRLHGMIETDPFLSTLPETAAYFFEAEGRAKAAGASLRNPELARTLRAIAEGGADTFYRGPIARDIANAVRNAPVNPGTMTETDLAGYRAVKRAPLCRPYRAYRVCGMPPPSAGGVAILQALALLEPFDLAALPPGSAPAVHLVSEASRLAYADRDAYVADPDFAPVPVGALLDETYLAGRARAISPVRSMGKAEPGRLTEKAAGFPAPRVPESVSTTHVSVVDAHGDAVAFTSSIENVFGSRLMVRGFLLNNQLTDFSFLPAVGGVPLPNRVEPGKRPRSSMAPTLVFDGEGKLLLAVGTPGGSRIVAFVLQTLVAVLDWGLGLQEAIDLPRHVNRNGETELEAGTALEDIAAELEERGHRVALCPLVSGLFGIRVLDSGLEGGADPRREGVALGE